MSHENFRRLTQFILARGCVKADEFHDFLHSLRSEGSSQLTDESIGAVIANLNSKLKKYNMMVRSSTGDGTYQKYYSLISTIDNAITKEASHHTAKEFEYFRLIWEVIREEPLEIDRARDLANSIKLTNHAELLSEWCEKYWLINEGGSYRQGPRAKAELDVLT